MAQDTTIQVCMRGRGTATHIALGDGRTLCIKGRPDSDGHSVRNGDYLQVTCGGCLRAAAAERVGCEGCAVLTDSYKIACDECRDKGAGPR